jgi:hypothetical protein
MSPQPGCAATSKYKGISLNLPKCGKAEIFGNDSNKSKLHFQKAYNLKEFLLPFGAEHFLFKTGLQKHRDSNVQNYNFTRSFTWVCNFVWQTTD